MTILENIPLAPLTTLQVGGPARYFAEGRSEEEVAEAVQFAKSRRLPLFILGGGSNLVIAEAGWPGLVLKISIGGISKPEAGEQADGPALFRGGAGVEWDHLVALAVGENCSGIECLSGIPGSVGGTPVQNVGAYGQEVSQTIESVRALDMRSDRIVTLPAPACSFGYRRSIFNGAERGRFIVLRVDFRLIRGGVANIKNGDLQNYFADRGHGEKALPSLSETREAVRQIRKSKGMLLVPGDEDCRSAGSFFKNPVLKKHQFKDLSDRAQSQGLILPSYPALDAHHKVSAAWLVEHSGFAKGDSFGAAGISSRHALALINRGDAQASDIVDLKNKIQRGVEDAWGVKLETEPVFVGFEP